MTLTIALEPELEKRLVEQASREGIEPGEYARRILEGSLPAKTSQPPAPALSPEAAETLKLLDDWERENATTDPEEIARRTREGEEFMRTLARNRVEMEGPNARKLWP
jgi:hypothetical protein